MVSKFLIESLSVNARIRQFLLVTLTILVIGAAYNNCYSQHFTPVWGDQNPQTWMNVIVSSATIDGVDIEINDEIAVFDIDAGSGEEVCVGFTSISNGSGPYFINAGQDNGDGGFTPGNPILFRIWDESAAKEISLVISVFDLTPPLVDVYTANGLASAELSSYTFSSWTGNISTDWNNSANWDIELVPSLSLDVYIPSNGVNNYPVLNASSSGECNNITLEATATGIASILGNEHLTVNGSAKMQTYITADQWHMVSSPVTGTNVGFYSLGGDPKVYLTNYDEGLESYNYLTDPATQLNTMEAYMLWVCDYNNTYEYSGSMNSGTYGETDNLSRNNSGSGNEGWHMVGNPYPSSIDWNASNGWTKSANMGGAIYIYNTGLWEYYLDDSPSGHSTNGSRYVAPGQGFFVRVLSGSNGTLIMNNDVRVHNNTQFFKATTNSDAYVKLLVSRDGKKDETIVRFMEGATANFDGQYDVFKKFSALEGQPQLYTYSDENYYINSMSSVHQVSIGFYADTEGVYTISIEELKDIGNIWLEDLKEGQYFDLTAGNYDFSYNPDEVEDRFMLHFAPVSTEDKISESLNIFSHQNTIHINPTEEITGSVSIFNLVGQEIHKTPISGSNQTVNIRKPGIYIVMVSTGNTTKTQAVTIH